MAEIHDAIHLANQVLDTPNRDPDDDISMMCRQFLRAFEANKNLMDALEASVTLQSHYASLLNAYDGGERMQFGDARAWLDRLRAVAGCPDAEFVDRCERVVPAMAGKSLLRAPSAAPAVDPHDPVPTDYKPRGAA